MDCSDLPIERIICAISENGSVRPFDVMALAVAMVGVLATALIPAAIWRIDQGRVRRERRLTALEALCDDIDSIDLNFIASSTDPEFALRNSYRDPLTRYGQSFFRDPHGTGLLAIVQGEFEFASNRMAPCWGLRPQMRQKLNELKSDLRADLSAWESMREFRKDVAALQKANPSLYKFYIPWEVNLAVRNGQHKRQARQVRDGIRLLVSKYIWSGMHSSMRNVRRSTVSLPLVAWGIGMANVATRRLSRQFWQAVDKAGKAGT
jgi:hypothetical protein